MVRDENRNTNCREYFGPVAELESSLKRYPSDIWSEANRMDADKKLKMRI